MNVQFTTLTKRKNSTLRPLSFDKTMSCQIKEPCNIRTPVIIVKTSTFSVYYNYAYISKWGYYYFVTDMTVITGDRMEVSLSADVLATYRSQIANYSCFVERCASSSYYNVLVNDNLLSSTENITNVSSASTSITDLDYQGGFYILRTVCNQGGSPGGIASYILTNSMLNEVLSFMFTESNFSDVLTDETVKTFFNPFQYIVDIKWFPYIYETYSAVQILKSTVKFGWWDSGVEAYYVQGSSSGFYVYCDSINIPDNIYSDWRKYNDNFSLYTIYLPCVGTMQISAKDVENGLCCRYDIDITSGEAQIRLYSGKLTKGEYPDGILIATYKTTISVPIQIGQLNSVTSKTISGIASTIGDVLSFNWGRAAETAVETSRSALSPTPSINGATGERYILQANEKVWVFLNNLGSCEYATSVAGRPCYKNLTLGNLSGYVKCGNASLALSGYDSDMEEVNSYLNGGFYME